MLGKNTVVASVAVNDLEDAMYFYGTVLGLKKMVSHSRGVRYESGSGAIALYESAEAGRSYIMSAWWDVENVELVVRKLKKKGVTFIKNRDLPLDTCKNDVYYLGGSIKAAWFRDPDGNIFGIGNA